MSKRYVLRDEITRRREAGSVTIDLGDGEEITIDPPDLWPDDVQSALQAAVQGDDVVGLAKAILGADDYDRLIDAGGNSTLLLSIYKDGVGDLGEFLAS